MHNQNTHAPASMRLLRQPEVLHLTRLSRSTLWRMQKQGTFPKARQLPGVRAIAWIAAEVEAWLAQLPAPAPTTAPLGVS